MSEDNRKEQDREFALQPAPASPEKRERPRPRLVSIEDRTLTSDRRWHSDLAAEYIEARGRSRWIAIEELARVFFHLNCDSNRRRVRRRLHQVGRSLLARDVLLVVESRHDGAHACKIYDPRLEGERQLFCDWIARLRRNHLVKADQIARALELAECLERLGET